MISRPDTRYRTLASGQARLPALLIATVVVAAVCVAATWPRWHPVTATTPTVPQSSTPSALNVATSTTSTSRSGTSSAEASTDAPVTPAPSANAVASSVPNPGAAPNAVSAAAAAPVNLATPPVPLTTAAIPENPPNWDRLNDAQRTALGPFAAQWDKFSDQQKRKWLAIAAVYPRMSLSAQQRLHARMLRWTQMTPEERMLARENYELSRVLPPSARQQAWLAYEALPPAQKAKLAAAEKLHRRRLVVSALPNAHVDPHARRSAQKPGAHDDPHALTLETLVPLGTPGAAALGAASATSSVTSASPAPAGNGAAAQREPSTGAGTQARPETAGDAKP